MPENIFHITTADRWDEALAGGEYRHSTLDRTLEQEGFIHCATAAQVPGVLDRFYQGQTDLVRLEIDPTRAGVELRWEGDPEAFPHLYGALSVAAVVRLDPIEA